VCPHDTHLPAWHLLRQGSRAECSASASARQLDVGVNQLAAALRGCADCSTWCVVCCVCKASVVFVANLMLCVCCALRPAKVSVPKLDCGCHMGFASGLVAASVSAACLQ
jgi:hypothetical protein